MSLILDANFTDADGFYDALIKAHDGLTSAQSAELNARIILILANHIGEFATLRAALDAATDRDL